MNSQRSQDSELINVEVLAYTSVETDSVFQVFDKLYSFSYEKEVLILSYKTGSVTQRQSFFSLCLDFTTLSGLGSASHGPWVCSSRKGLLPTSYMSYWLFLLLILSTSLVPFLNLHSVTFARISPSTILKNLRRNQTFSEMCTSPSITVPCLSNSGSVNFLRTKATSYSPLITWCQDTVLVSCKVPRGYEWEIQKWMKADCFHHKCWMEWIS